MTPIQSSLPHPLGSFLHIYGEFAPVGIVLNLIISSDFLRDFSYLPKVLCIFFLLLQVIAAIFRIRVIGFTCFAHPLFSVILLIRLAQSNHSLPISRHLSITDLLLSDSYTHSVLLFIPPPISPQDLCFYVPRLQALSASLFALRRSDSITPQLSYAWFLLPARDFVWSHLLLLDP